jgi:hypothetical protein
MSVQEIEDRVRQLPPEELRRFAEWWRRFCETSPTAPLPEDGAAPQAESDEVKQELLRRQQEYREHPERFLHIADSEQLDGFLKEVRRRADNLPA